MRKRLTRGFFNRPTLTVSKDLLGKYIVHRVCGKELVGRIVETESYIGPHDRAAHSYGNRVTKRNGAEYLDGGHVYIYLVYGMHWQFNISAAGKGKGECVLIRAVEPVSANIKACYCSSLSRTQRIQYSRLGSNSKRCICPLLANGPGKLCKYLKLDKKLYGVDMCRSKRIWLEDRGLNPPKHAIAASERIGIDYAGEPWAGKLWRFFVRKSPYVSHYKKYLEHVRKPSFVAKRGNFERKPRSPTKNSRSYSEEG